MELLIGDKLWSTWSMRAVAGAEAHRRAVHRDADPPAARGHQRRRPRRRLAQRPVPVLKDGDVTVWDSLAICEYLAEKFPAARLWPADPAARALGRVGGGGDALELRLAARRVSDGPRPATGRVRVSEATHNDLRRLVELWSGLLGRFGGQFLVGDWSIADAFFTPVATRLRSYGLRLSDYGDPGPCGAYAERLLETPEFLAWEQAALADVR